MKKNVCELDYLSQFKELSEVDTNTVDGGLVAGALLGAANGWGAGLMCAFVASWTTPDWTWTDTKKCMITGAVTGAYIGAFIPV